MKSKKVLLMGALVVMLSAAVVAGIARAESENENERGRSESAPGQTIQHEVKMQNAEAENEGGDENQGNGNTTFSIQPNGNISLGNASLLSIAGDTLTVKSFGLTLTVNTGSSTRITGVDNTSTSTAMQAGDLLDIKGSIDSNSGVVTASTVRDRSRESQNNQDILQKIQALFAQLKQLQDQLSGMGIH